MEKKFKRTTVTSALPYANGPVHIGHLAGVYVPADIYVRYLRLKKEDVLFIGGSDEHGVPITIRAKKEGVTPQDIVDRYHMIAVYDILWSYSFFLCADSDRYSMFVRTANEEHIFFFQAQIAHVNIGRYVNTCQMADMDRTVGIRQSRCHGRSLEFFFHIRI